jgi:outer membrane protein assembly factor BamA
VVYAITEGEKSRISKVAFVGNERFNDGDLQAIIATKKSTWWRFLSTADSYDPARIEVDRDLVRRFYLSRGYADVQITSAVAELTRDQRDFVITFTVFEGPQYDFGNVDLALQAEAEALIEAPIEAPAVLVQTVTPKVEGLSYQERWSAEVTNLPALIAYVASRPEFSHLLEPNMPAMAPT